jgi:hypothetical protein
MPVRMTAARATLAQVAQGLADAVALSVAISSIAFATPRQPPPVASLDRNADERLSRSEASYDRTLAEIFASCDLDGNGFVDRDEYARATLGYSARTET